MIKNEPFVHISSDSIPKEKVTTKDSTESSGDYLSLKQHKLQLHEKSSSAIIRLPHVGRDIQSEELPKYAQSRPPFS